MQPTIQSQVRMKRLVWLLGLLLPAALLVGGIHVNRLGNAISRLEHEAGAGAAALAAARRETLDARQAADAAAKAQRAAQDRAQASESARAKAETLAKTADSVRVELEGKLKAAEAARAEAEARLKSEMAKIPANTPD